MAFFKTTLVHTKNVHSLERRATTFLLESLDHLPLHRNTLDILEKKIKQDARDLNFISSMSNIVLNYEKAAHKCVVGDKNKILESLIYHTYFIWNNPLPDHLENFRRNYETVLSYWPFERHRTLLGMQNPKKTSLRFNWNNSNSCVLSMMKYKKNPWMNYYQTGVSSEIEEFKHALHGSTYPLQRQTQNKCSLTNIDRDTLFNSIFSHYLFLKCNSRFCKNGKVLPIPIVEIPLRPLGQDIAASRIRNLFKKKVATTWKFLSLENPTLSSSNELALFEIISETDNRFLQRLYQRTCKRAYVIEKKNNHNIDNTIGNCLPTFKASDLLLKNI